MDLTLLLRALGAMAAAALALWVSKRDSPHDSSGAFGDLLGAVLVGMALGRLAYVAGAGIDLLENPVELVFVRGGVSPVAAAIGALAYLVWTCRSDLLDRTDRLAPAVLTGLAAWEAGCLWQGSCLGSPTGVWWAMSLPGSDLARHPVAIYQAALLIVGAALLWWRPLRWRGAIAASALAWASAIRMSVPLWSVTGWSTWRWWYVAGVLIGLSGVVGARLRCLRGNGE